MAMRPMRVRAYLRTGVISDRYLPLDGVLLFQAARRTFGPRDATLPGQSRGHSPKHVHGLVPLVERNPGRQWYYACSFAQWPEHVAEGKDYWNKRFDNGYAELLDLGRQRKVNVGEGRYRSYHMPVFYLAALWVEWYAVGNIDAVRSLLADVWALGKKTVQGFGRVARWEVEPWPEDWSEWRRGQPMRAIPASALPATPTNLRLWGFRPSYWLPENQALCLMPRE
jgi:hypothetical protein